MIQLRGVMQESLGGFLTLRGYMSLSKLALISRANESYQRVLNEEHLESIREFYTRGEYLFYPEIVLGLELKVDYDKPGTSPLAPLKAIKSEDYFKSNVDDSEVSILQNRKGTDMQSGVIKITDDTEKPLSRIDGNHRLKAFEQIASGSPPSDTIAPYCIIMFDHESTRNEKAIFHNINSQAKRLTSEEILKGLIDDEVGFDDSILARDFGPEFVLTRRMADHLNFDDYLDNVRGVFFRQFQGVEYENYRSAIVEAGKLVREKSETGSLPNENELLEIIKEIDAVYSDRRLIHNTSVGLFIAFVYFKICRADMFNQFKGWVVRNHIYELLEVRTEDLIRIFEKVAESKKKQVFVSMCFGEEASPNYDAIKAAVGDVNQAHGLEIPIKEIRVDKLETGFSYPIPDRILGLIEDCSLFVADLTTGNVNVYHELGYLMGLNEGRQLPQENFILLHNGQLGDTGEDIGFNIRHIKQLRVDDTHTLREELKKQIEIYFGLQGV